MTRFEIINKHLMIDDTTSDGYLFFIRRNDSIPIDKFYCLGIDELGHFHAEVFHKGKWHDLPQQMANIMAMIAFPISPTLSMYHSRSKRHGKV